MTGNINLIDVCFLQIYLTVFASFYLQETDFKEWKLVVQEIVRFLKADTAFMNIRPLRYSHFVDPHPDSIPHLPPSIARRNLRLRDVILSSYHTNEVFLSRFFFLVFCTKEITNSEFFTYPII